MKFTPFLFAALVASALYLLVFERDLVTAYIAPPVEVSETEEAVAETETQADTPTSNAIRVSVIHSAAELVDSAVVLRGRTEAAREVIVAAETSGQVISEPLRKGTFVEAGDIMCELYPGTREATLAEARARLAEAMGRVPEAEASVAEARARWRETEQNLDNARRLSEDGFASETQLISAEAAFEAAEAGVSRATASIASAEAGIEAAEAGVAAAEREIERLTIRAPFAGLLETDTAELGSLMQPGSPCATIIQLDPIKLVGFVPELEVDQISVGSQAGARLTSGRELLGTVNFVSRRGDDLTRTFRVEIIVPNADLSIRDGQTADILVAAEGETAHLIPQSAMTLNDEGRLGVRVVDDSSLAQWANIEVVRDTIEGVWVSGLPQEATIIVIGQEYVINDVLVEPVELVSDPDAQTTEETAVTGGIAADAEVSQ